MISIVAIDTMYRYATAHCDFHRKTALGVVCGVHTIKARAPAKATHSCNGQRRDGVGEGGIGRGRGRGAYCIACLGHHPFTS